MNLLLVNAESWILPGILLALCVVLFVLYFFRNKKYQQNAENMSNSLKKGDKVKTYSGVYGTIVEIVDNNGERVVTIETGTEKNKSYVSFDIRAVYAINEPKPVETPAVEAQTTNEAPATPVEEKPAEVAPVEAPAEVVVEEKPAEVVEKKPRKPRAKKETKAE